MFLGLVPVVGADTVYLLLLPAASVVGTLCSWCALALFNGRALSLRLSARKLCPKFWVADYLTSCYDVPGAPVTLGGAVFLSVISPDSILSCGLAGNFPLISGRLERCLSGTG